MRSLLHKLLLAVLLAQGVLCPCAAIAGDGEPTDASHHAHAAHGMAPEHSESASGCEAMEDERFCFAAETTAPAKTAGDEDAEKTETPIPGQPESSPAGAAADGPLYVPDRTWALPCASPVNRGDRLIE